MKINPKQKGYTLLETLIYAAILIVVALAVTDGVINMSKTMVRAKAFADVRNGGTLAMERIVREIQTANSVDMGASVLSAHPGRLVLNSTDEFGAARVVDFTGRDGSISLADGGADKGFLLNRNATTTNLVFRASTTPKSTFVKVELTVQSKRAAASALPAQKFYGTAVLRGSY